MFRASSCVGDNESWSKTKSKHKYHVGGSTGRKIDVVAVDSDKHTKEQPESSAQDVDANKLHAKGKEIVSEKMGASRSAKLHHLFEADREWPYPPSEERPDWWSKELQAVTSGNHNKEIQKKKSWSR